MREFYKILFSKAFTDTNGSLGFSKEKAMPAILVWAVITLIIYSVSPEIELKQELTLGLCSIISIFLVWPVIFVAQCFLAPAKIYKDNIEKINSLETDISKIKNKEDLLKDLSEFCTEGKDLYFKGFNDEKSKTEWDKNKIQWSIKVENFIESNINISTLHAFKNTRHGAMHFTHENLNNDYTFQYMDEIQDFSGKIDMLEEYIQINESGWRNDLNDN